MSAPQNPPAFPNDPRTQLGDDYQGMTLRDWFAGQAFGVAIGQAHGLGGMPPNERAAVFKQAAEIIYEAADAMLAARGDA